MTKRWPLLLALLLYAALFALQFRAVWQATGGQQLFTLDDPYIHAAIAKNLVRHGVYGVTRHEFAFSASSILWPFLLAGVYLLTGVHAVTPLILNVLAAIGTLFAADRAFRHWAGGKGGEAGNALQLALLVTSGSLLGLTFIGMEHTLQVLTCLMALHYGARVYDGEEDRKTAAWMCAWVALAAAARYEGLFLALAAGIMFAAARRWKWTLLIGAVSAAPPALFGIYEKLHDGWLLPIPLVLKPADPALRSLFRFAGPEGVSSSYAFDYGIAPLWLLAAVLLLLPHKWLPLRKGHRFLLAVFVGTTVLHLDLAQMGWLFRYEAYLVAMGIFAILAALTAAWAPEGGAGVRSRYAAWLGGTALGFGYLLASDVPGRMAVEIAIAGAAVATIWLLIRRLRVTQARGPRWRFTGYEAMTILGIWVVASLALRAQTTFQTIPAAATAIYEQQYQTARFLERYYPEGRIAANDIGAINYFNDLDCLDLYGLGSQQVTALKHAKALTASRIADLVRQQRVQMVVGYRYWLAGRELPDNWVPVATWTIRKRNDEITIGSTTVTFYGVDDASAATLRRQVQEFAPQLPSGVKVVLLPAPAAAGPATDR